jgi:sporulation protein YlmC with PRC-barrel domain
MAGVSGPALSATAEECQTKFQAADANKDGVLKMEEATLFMDAVTKAQIQLKEASVISRDEFASACEKDVFANIQVPAAADQSTATAPAASGEATTNTQASTDTQSTTGTTTATTQGTAEQPAATTDQSASTTTTQPSTTDQSASTTTEQPATTTDHAASTTEQPATTTDQAATTTEQPAATTDQAASTTETQPSTEDQTASTEQPAATDQGATGTQALAPPQGFLASKLIGSTVYTKDDQSIGDINDVIVAQDAAQADGVIVGIGGFLGIGEKNVLLDMSKLTFVPTDDGGAKIVIDTSKADLESMPAYEGNQQQTQQ